MLQYTDLDLDIYFPEESFKLNLLTRYLLKRKVRNLFLKTASQHGFIKLFRLEDESKHSYSNNHVIYRIGSYGNLNTRSDIYNDMAKNLRKILRMKDIVIIRSSTDDFSLTLEDSNKFESALRKYNCKYFPIHFTLKSSCYQRNDQNRHPWAEYANQFFYRSELLFMLDTDDETTTYFKLTYGDIIKYLT